MKHLYTDEVTGAVVRVERCVHGTPDLHYLTKVECPSATMGEGGATRVLQRVCWDADCEGSRLRLVIIPKPDTEVRRRLLREWYRTFGFVGDGEMERMPRAAG
jgi:hypothetical protein